LRFVEPNLRIFPHWSIWPRGGTKLSSREKLSTSVTAGTIYLSGFSIPRPKGKDKEPGDCRYYRLHQEGKSEIKQVRESQSARFREGYRYRFYRSFKAICYRYRCRRYVKYAKVLEL